MIAAGEVVEDEIRARLLYRQRQRIRPSRQQSVITRLVRADSGWPAHMHRPRGRASHGEVHCRRTVTHHCDAVAACRQVRVHVLVEPVAPLAQEQARPVAKHGVSDVPMHGAQHAPAIPALDGHHRVARLLAKSYFVGKVPAVDDDGLGDSDPAVGVLGRAESPRTRGGGRGIRRLDGDAGSQTGSGQTEPQGAQSHAESYSALRPLSLLSRSGRWAASIRRKPSRQGTVVCPTSSCMRVRSRQTLASDCSLGPQRADSPVSDPRYSHHSSTLTRSSPPQFTTVAGTDAAWSSFGTIATMSSEWIGWNWFGASACTATGWPASIIARWNIGQPPPSPYGTLRRAIVVGSCHRRAP